MMSFVEREGLESIISWVRNGRALMVHNPEKLVELLPLFFSQTKYRSFQRQLNMWHFERVLDGPDKGAFIHPYFIKGNKPLCAYMSRHGLNMPLPKHLVKLLQNEHSWTNNMSNGESSMDKSSDDLLQSALSLPDCEDGEHDVPHGSDLKDGDISVFEGRKFYFVECMASDRSVNCQIEPEEVTTPGSYNLDSVFRDLQERKRCLLEQSKFDWKDQLSSGTELFCLQ